jgi:hypothetical protein
MVFITGHKKKFTGHEMETWLPPHNRNQENIKFMNTPIIARELTEEAPHSPKSKKLSDDLSQSRDTREDSGPCRMKTMHDSQALFDICGDF